MFFPADVRGFDQAGHVPTTLPVELQVQRELPQSISWKSAMWRMAATICCRGMTLNCAGVRIGVAATEPGSAVANLSATSDGRLRCRSRTLPAVSRYGDLRRSRLRRVLQLSFAAGEPEQERSGQGTDVRVAYTWSKALGVASGDGDLLHPTNFRMANYSLSRFRRPHILVINFMYDIPNLIASTSAGQHSGRTSSSRVAGVGLASTMARASRPTSRSTSRSMAATEPRSTRVRNRWSARAADGQSERPEGHRAVHRHVVFRAPVIGSLGWSRRSASCGGRGSTTGTLRFSRIFRWERRAVILQLRLEMFNASNHTQFSDFNRTVTV